MALILLPWGLLAIVSALLGLVVLGCSDRYRWIAALGVAGIVAGSTAVLLRMSDAALEAAGFFVPGALAFAIAAWIAISEWPGSARS